MSTSSLVDREGLAVDEAFIPAQVARMVEGALLFCSHRTSHKRESDVAAALAEGEQRSQDCFRHYLSLQVAEYLRALDDNLAGAYSYSYGDAEEEGEGRSSSPTESLKLILRVRRKTAALNAVLAALDDAMLEEYRKLIEPVGDKMTTFLDAQMVDDEEAEQGSGLACVLKSAFTPPTQVWSNSR